MLRSVALTLVLAVVGWRSAAWLTQDFRVWTAEGARRLAVMEHPVDTPRAALRGPGVTGVDLRARVSGARQATIVNFIYTRCPTVCQALGSSFQQIQQALGATPGDGVRLLSISFDPLHDDVASLQRHAAQWHADPAVWTFAAVPDPLALKRLLKAFQVVVIDDGRGGFEHNAALLVIDERGRLVRVFDESESDLAMNCARRLAAGLVSSCAAP